jgi:hypothetical protein
LLTLFSAGTQLLRFAATQWRVARSGLLTILFVAAILKLHALISNPASLVELPFLVALAAFVELLTVIWICVSWRESSESQWWMLLFLFVVLTLGAVRYLWLGVPCSCFGVHSPAHFALLLDVAAVVWLLLVRRGVFKHVTALGWLVKQLPTITIPLCGALVTMSVIAVAVLVQPFRAIIFSNLGFAVIPDQFVRSTLIPESGAKEADAVFRLHNPETTPVSVLGIETSCNCMAATDLGMTILPKSHSTLVLRVRLSEKPRLERAKLILGSASRPVILSVRTRVPDV